MVKFRLENGALPMDNQVIAESVRRADPLRPGNEGLQRRLKPRQLTMMAIGGAIGVGLFLGSSLTIELAGPGVIVSYVLGAMVAMVVAYSLAEMAVVHPVAGSFGVYAETYLSRWARSRSESRTDWRRLSPSEPKSPRWRFTSDSGSHRYRRRYGCAWYRWDW